MQPLRLVPAFLLLTLACVDQDAAPRVTVAAAGPNSRPCEEVYCGNTPHLGAHAFWELDKTMTQFSPYGGLRITSLTGPYGTPLTPAVDSVGLYGRDAGGIARIVVGGEMMLEADDGSRYQLAIEAGDGIHYKGGGHVPGDPLLPTYRFTYRTVNNLGYPDGPVEDLCRGDGDHSVARDALVYQGDRYDLTTGVVWKTGVGTAPWFNIACNDDAMWKVALMRHAEFASAEGFVTSRAQRTAALRSIRADYCGTGLPHTEVGVALEWANRGGWLSVNPQWLNPTVEAVWADSGLFCLNTPRFEEPTECAPQSCTTRLGDRPLPADWAMITYTP